MADEPEVVFGRWLVALQSAIANPIVTLKRIGALVTSRTQKRFDTQIGPDGKEWPDRWTPNIPGILEDLERGAGIKDRRWQPRPVLLDTGNLRWSIDWALEGTSVVKIGTAVDHAKFHQFGLERIIPITDTMREGISELISKLARKSRLAATKPSRNILKSVSGYEREILKTPGLSPQQKKDLRKSFKQLGLKKAAKEGVKRQTKEANQLLWQDSLLRKLGGIRRLQSLQFTVMERPFIGIDDQDHADILEMIHHNFLSDATGSI
jgi:phage gpG-like protein